ncbi:hypothetical protein [Micromonospora sp. WMMD736]|uniref:hypothetical protein n=1 Tax=Micromonospora sp. WMMD736 TaxID=3404112 RepID=UPI003B946176
MNITKPFLSYGVIYAGANVSGDCSSGTYKVGLWKKRLGVWDFKAYSPTFNVGGGTSVGVPCSSGTWVANLFRGATEITDSAEVNITC